VNRKEQRVARFSVFCPEIVNCVVNGNLVEVPFTPTARGFLAGGNLLNLVIYTLPSR